MASILTPEFVVLSDKSNRFVRLEINHRRSESVIRTELGVVIIFTEIINNEAVFLEDIIVNEVIPGYAQPEIEM